MNASKIKEALSLVHHYEKSETRPEAAKRAIRMTGLAKDEAEVLLRSIHVKPEELKPPCDCGAEDAYWHGDAAIYPGRVYCCEACWTRILIQKED